MQVNESKVEVSGSLNKGLLFIGNYYDCEMCRLKRAYRFKSLVFIEHFT